MNNQGLKSILMTPGPVPLHPKVVAALSEPMVHHRTPKFDLVLKECLEKLKSVFVTQERCFLLTSTGSGGMEALLINVLTPGCRVLAIDSGKFGERWAEMAKVYGAHVTTLKIPWGEAVDLAQLEDAIKKESFDIVMTQACETSTGVLHPIENLSKLLKKVSPQTLLLVDAITALGATRLPLDEWEIDGIVGGSQKAFMLPTGLSFLSFSKRAWSIIDNNPTPRFYFDIRKELLANKSGQTYFSSNVTLIRALNIALDLMLKDGLNHHLNTVSKIATLSRDLAKDLGLVSFSKSPSPSVSALVTPVDSQKLRDLLEAQFGLVVMGGQDQAKGKILRIGHMGYIKKQDVIDSMKRIQQGLEAMGYNQFNLQSFNAKINQLSLEPEFYL